MSVALYNPVAVRRLLLVQFIVLVLLSAVFALNSQKWVISAFIGGLSACLPNALFLLLTWLYRYRNQSDGRLSWSFFISEIVKIVMTIALLAIALAVFKAKFLPLCVTYLAVLVVPMLMSAIVTTN
ncbi:MAG: ATP synthase subunit I [Enterobacteriaceae bacterium]|jgi:ATP synthase protein I|nr:ATP synthase subunit I [Enterobacteriaceae bacterium]